MEAMKRKKASAFLDRVAKFSPELAGCVEEIKRDYAAGKLHHPPRRSSDCKSWLDIWLYAFKRAHLYPEDHVKIAGGKVTCVAWVGPDFGEKLVALLERCARRVGPDLDLLELRLVRTRVGAQGMERLRALFPKARIVAYSEKQECQNPDIVYVNQ